MLEDTNSLDRAQLPEGKGVLIVIVWREQLQKRSKNGSISMNGDLVGYNYGGVLRPCYLQSCKKDKGVYLKSKSTLKFKHCRYTSFPSSSSSDFLSPAGLAIPSGRSIFQLWPDEGIIIESLMMLKPRQGNLRQVFRLFSLMRGSAEHETNNLKTSLRFPCRGLNTISKNMR